MPGSWLMSLLTPFAALVGIVATYLVTRQRNKSDTASQLTNDALQLNDRKEVDIDRLTREIESIRAQNILYERKNHDLEEELNRVKTNFLLEHQTNIQLRANIQTIFDLYNNLYKDFVKLSARMAAIEGHGANTLTASQMYGSAVTPLYTMPPEIISSIADQDKTTTPITEPPITKG